MISLLDDLKSFIRSRVTTKSNYVKSALGKKKTSYTHEVYAIIVCNKLFV